MDNYVLVEVLTYILDRFDLSNEDKLELYNMTDGELFPEIKDYKEFKEWKDSQYWGGKDNEPKYHPNWRYWKNKGQGN